MNRIHYLTLLAAFAMLPGGFVFGQKSPGAQKPGGPKPKLHKPEIHKPEMEKRTYLGVATSDVHPVLRQHLELREGFGVLINDVPEDSPAAGAGLKAGDILTRLDDQLLTTPEHLSILIRSKQKGDSVKLAFLRKGKEESVEVVLEEKELPRIHAKRLPMNFDYSPKNWHNWHQDMQKRQEEMRKKMKEGFQQETPHPPRKDLIDPPKKRPSPPKPILKNESAVNIDNDHGEVKIIQKDGKGHIEIFDAGGARVYEGPFDKEKGIDGLPESAREHLRKMKVNHIEILSPSKPHPPKPPRKKENSDKPS